MRDGERVLISESLAQAAVPPMMAPLPIDTGKLTFLMGTDWARSRRPVVPGDLLELHFEESRAKTPVWKQAVTAIAALRAVAPSRVSGDFD